MAAKGPPELLAAKENSGKGGPRLPATKRNSGKGPLPVKCGMQPYGNNASRLSPGTREKRQCSREWRQSEENGDNCRFSLAPGKKNSGKEPLALFPGKENSGKGPFSLPLGKESGGKGLRLCRSGGNQRHSACASGYQLTWSPAGADHIDPTFNRFDREDAVFVLAKWMELLARIQQARENQEQEQKAEAAE